jgi:HAE1 family hydrophobic/amphiphilic exporter-1
VNLLVGYANSGLGGAGVLGQNPFTASNDLLYARVNQLSIQAGLVPIPQPDFGGAAGSLVGGYGTSLSNLFGGKYPTLQAGVSIDFTFRNTTAEANVTQSVIAERRLKLQQAQIEQLIAADVRNALQALQTAKQRITAAEASVRASNEKLDSETRLFQTGESTNFLVLTRQNELADSRHRLLVAQLAFNRAVARLKQANGTTLEAHQISLK